MDETTYTSFDLMKIFGIKKGSWYNIAKKFNLDKYAEQTVIGKQVKFIYNEQAYQILKDNYQAKIVKEIKENPKMLSLIKDNETLKATLDEYKNIISKFELMYNEEKTKKEELIKENATLITTNQNYVEKNHELEKEKYKAEQEAERLKNRNFLQRLLNK